jgi:hypothetical protein
MPEPKETWSQHRRWLKTRFVLGRKKLGYSVASKQEANLEESVGWDVLGPRSSYVTTVEPDRDLRWTLFLMSGLALFAAFRANVHPLLLLGLYGGVTAIALFGLVLTRKLRSVGYTAVPAGTFNVLVLDDRKHDAILADMEARRADALLRSLATSRGLTLRIYLRRLRWLVENGVMTRQAFLERQAALLPNENLLPQEPASTAEVSFSQRRLATRIDVTLEAAQLVYRRWSLFDGSERFAVDYRNLREPSRHEETDKQVWLTAILIAWAGAGLISWGSWIHASHPAGYYVGGIGLQRAIVDFGPMLLACIAAAAFIPMLTQVRVARPWPGLLFLRNRQYETIVAEIEKRQVAALRALADPDPLLQPEEQVQLLDELLETGVLTEEEHARAVERAEFAFGDPALDQPLSVETVAERERVLH